MVLYFCKDHTNQHKSPLSFFDCQLIILYNQLSLLLNEHQDILIDFIIMVINIIDCFITNSNCSNYIHFDYYSY